MVCYEPEMENLRTKENIIMEKCSNIINLEKIKEFLSKTNSVGEDKEFISNLSSLIVGLSNYIKQKYLSNESDDLKIGTQWDLIVFYNEKYEILPKTSENFVKKKN